MRKRYKDWDETLQKELKNPKFAKKYIEASIKEGLPIQIAISQIVKAIGVVEYARKIGIHSQNIHRILHNRSNPTLNTMQMLLAPLGLTIGIIETTGRYKKAVLRSKADH